MGSLLPSSHSVSKQSRVFLNVYDLTPLNNYLYWLGVGIHHSGIEVHGVEYAFGAHACESSGVFEVEPKSCPGFVFRRSVLLGTTDLSPSEFRDFIDRVASSYHGTSYNLMEKNCNHFTDDISKQLTGKHIPGWVNRLARIGSICSCLLPESMEYTAVHPAAEYDGYSDEDSDSNSSDKQADSDGEQDNFLFSSDGDTRDNLHEKALKYLKFQEIL